MATLTYEQLTERAQLLFDEEFDRLCVIHDINVDIDEYSGVLKDQIYGKLLKKVHQMQDCILELSLFGFDEEKLWKTSLKGLQQLQKRMASL